MGLEYVNIWCRTCGKMAGVCRCPGKDYKPYDITKEDASGNLKPSKKDWSHAPEKAGDAIRR